MIVAFVGSNVVTSAKRMDPRVCVDSTSECVLSNLQEASTRRLAGGSLQSQCVELKLALVVAPVSRIGLVVDDRPGCGIGPGEIDTAFDYSAIVEFDDHWHLSEDLPAVDRRDQRVGEHNAGDLVGGSDLFPCRIPPATGGRGVAARLQHCVKELAEAAPPHVAGHR